MTAIVIPNVFLPSTTISSTAMNANFTTVANAIQASLAIDGSVAMTGALKGANGTAALPAFSFNTDPNVGMYRKAADELGFATNGVLAFFLDAAAKGWFTGAADVAGALTVAGATTLAGALTMSDAASRTAFATALSGVGAGFGTSTNLASAATTDLGTIATHNVNVTGSTGITSFGSTASAAVPFYLVKFAAAPLITFNATSMITPGGGNLQMAAGDELLAEYLGSSNWRIVAVFKNTPTTPTVQSFLSGSGTYTPPANLKYVKVRMIGGGGGGGAVATNNGNNGVASSFGTWTALAGAGGIIAGAGAAGGAGGSGGVNGTGTLVARISGQNGHFGTNQTFGGAGGSSVFGGGAVWRQSTGADGVAGKANTGGGGSGGQTTGTGSGGGAGEYVEFFMTAAQIGASQAYVVGGGGNGGAAGTQAGGNGAAGILIVEEFYS